MRFLIGLAVAAVGTAASAADHTFPLTGDNTEITFVGTKKNGKHDGGFKSVSGQATADAGPATLAIEVAIDTDSLYSDDAKLTGHLKSPDFFNVKQNPTAKFQSTKVEKSDAGHTVTGDLTLNGQTESISFPAEINLTAGGLKLTSEFKIDRTKFGMTYGQGNISDMVAIKVKIDAKAKN